MNFKLLFKLCVADNEQCTHVIQNLSFQLGQYQTGMLAEKKPMALICKLSRGPYMPPPFTSVQDWFHYAFATSEIKGSDRGFISKLHFNVIFFSVA